MLLSLLGPGGPGCQTWASSLLARTVLGVQAPEILDLAASAARLKLASLAALAAESTPSHEMWLQMVNAEICIRNTNGIAEELVAPVLDHLVLLAHDALILGDDLASARAVRLLDLHLEISRELSAYRHFTALRPGNVALAAAATRVGEPAEIQNAVTANAMVTFDSLALEHAFSSSHELLGTAKAILDANPLITVHELLVTTRLTALPPRPASTPSSE